MLGLVGAGRGEIQRCIKLRPLQSRGLRSPRGTVNLGVN